MKNYLSTLCLSGLLACLSLAAGAQTAEERNCDTVRNMLEGGSSAAEAVDATVATGMDLVEATVFAMVCGGEQNREAIATAGVAAAQSLAQAQSVATAVKAAAGESGTVAHAADVAVDEYVRQMAQPFIHHDEMVPTGGGSYDPDGGTRPPVGGVPPPVSPST